MQIPSPGTTARLMRRSATSEMQMTPVADIRSAAVPAGEPRPAPYTIRRYRLSATRTLLVGYDCDGEPMLELRIPASAFSMDLVARLQHFCRDNDPARLRLVE